MTRHQWDRMGGPGANIALVLTVALVGLRIGHVVLWPWWVCVLPLAIVGLIWLTLAVIVFGFRRGM